MERVISWLKHFFVPHHGNGYRPHLFAKETIALLLIVLFVCEAAYLFVLPALLKKSDVLASVVASSLTELTNRDRLSAGLASLTWDGALAEAAQKKADDMAARGYFSHVSPEGRTPWYWLDGMGYQYVRAGENLAMNFTDSVDVEKAWMESPKHRDNIMKAQYTHVGIGIAQGMYEGAETTFVVQLFATPALPATPEDVSSVPAALDTPSVAPPAPLATVAPLDLATVTKSPSSPAVASPAHVVLGAEKEPLKTRVFSSVGATETPAIVPALPAAEVAPIPAVVAHPTHALGLLGMSRPLLAGFFVVLALLMCIAMGAVFLSRAAVPHDEIALGGALVVLAAFSFILMNAALSSNVFVPQDGQSASVVMAGR